MGGPEPEGNFRRHFVGGGVEDPDLVGSGHGDVEPPAVRRRDGKVGILRRGDRSGHLEGPGVDHRERVASQVGDVEPDRFRECV